MVWLFINTGNSDEPSHEVETAILVTRAASIMKDMNDKANWSLQTKSL